MKINQIKMLISLGLLLTSTIATVSLHAQSSNDAQDQQCTPLTGQFPGLGTEFSISAKNEFYNSMGFI